MFQYVYATMYTVITFNFLNARTLFSCRICRITIRNIKYAIKKQWIALVKLSSVLQIIFNIYKLENHHLITLITTGFEDLISAINFALFQVCH